MVKKWIVTCKDNKFGKEAKTFVKANTKEKAKIYAIKDFQKNGYYNFHIISIKEINI